MTTRFGFPGIPPGDYEHDGTYDSIGPVLIIPGFGRIAVPMAKVTKIPPPLPVEPQAGVYKINDVVAQRLSESVDDVVRWRIVGSEEWMSWETLCTKIFRSDRQDIMQLIDLSEMKRSDFVGENATGRVKWSVYRATTSNVTSLSIGSENVIFYDVQAERLGRALISHAMRKEIKD